MDNTDTAVLVRNEVIQRVGELLGNTPQGTSTWPLTPVEPEKDTVYGLSPDVFEAVIRALISGNNTQRSMVYGRVHRDGARLYVKMTPHDDWLVVGTYNHNYRHVMFEKTEAAKPIVEIADKMWKEGLLEKARPYSYYTPGITYPHMADTSHGHMSREVQRFIANRYREGNPADIVVARMMCYRLNHTIGGNVHYETGYNPDEAASFSESADGKMVKLTSANRLNRGSDGQDMKPIAAAKKILREWAQEGLTERDFEQFDTSWKAAFTISDEVEIVTGEEIRKAYHTSNHAPGAVASSCMSYDKNQTELDLYVENPKHIALVVARDKNKKVLGRGLIWTDDNGQRWHDIIYASERYKRYIAGWCKDNDILPLQLDTRSYAITVTLEHPWVKRSPPYLDTMRFINPDGVIRRESKEEGEWLPIGHPSIRSGWPNCRSCGRKATAKDLRAGNALVVCSECVKERLANPDNERINMMEDGLNGKAVVSVGGGMISYNGGIWAYDRESLSLVRVGDSNG